jgi:hypothetical protein
MLVFPLYRKVKEGHFLLGRVIEAFDIVSMEALIDTEVGVPMRHTSNTSETYFLPSRLYFPFIARALPLLNDARLHIYIQNAVLNT